MLSLAAAVESPEGRERLRDVTDIMLGHASGTPDDAQDDEIAEQHGPGECA